MQTEVYAGCLVSMSPNFHHSIELPVQCLVFLDLKWPDNWPIHIECFNTILCVQDTASEKVRKMSFFKVSFVMHTSTIRYE